MKQIKISLLLAVIASFLPLLAHAQNAILAKDLTNYLKQKNTVLISLQKASDYNEGHIDNAINFKHSSLYNKMAMLLPNDTVANILGANGISSDAKIILYDNANTKLTGRMYWVLTYMGAKKVSILSGGYKAWLKAEMPITTAGTVATPTIFTPHANAGYLATMQMVNKAIGNKDYVIIDARSDAEFEGTDETSLKPGHIPSAIHLNYTAMLNPNGELKSAKELKTIFKEAGVAKDKTIILYCRSSVRAGIEFYALNKVLKFPQVKVYDGAFIEWQSNDANEIEKK